MDTHSKETDNLNAQQITIIDLLARGSTNTEIASKLGLPLEAVKRDVVSIISKMGTASREAAVEAWRQKRRRERLLRRTGIGAGSLVALAVVSVIVLSFLGGSDPDESFDPALDDLEVRIITRLAPNPGFRVLEFPSGWESTFARTAVVNNLFWSPTNQHVLVSFEGRAGQYALVDYESRRTKVFFVDELSEEAQDNSWSPDGRLVYIHPGTELGREKENVVSPAYIYDSAGNRVAVIPAEELTDSPVADDWAYCRNRHDWSANSEFLLVSFMRSRPRTISADGTVTVIESAEACRELPPLYEYERLLPIVPSYYPDVLALEDRTPAKANVVSAHGLWPLGFVATIEVPGDPTTTKTLVSIGGRPLEFDGSAEGAQFMILGTDDVRPPGLPSVDTTGCPLYEEAHCQIAVRDARYLLDGEVTDLISQSVPRLVKCAQPDSKYESLCAAASGKLGEAAFTVKDRSGTLEYVSAFEFQLALGNLVSRFDGANAGASDEFGSGAPRFVSFTCGSSEAGFSCYEARLNFTWIEDGPSGAERVVVALSFDGSEFGGPFGLVGIELLGPGSDFDIALNGGDINTGNVRSQRRATLWALPD